MSKLDIYKGKKIFITGHTGFKGAWLAQWLVMLGADVYGYSLTLPDEPNHFTLLDLKHKMISTHGDITDADAVHFAINSFKPDFIFHLAAQPIVRQAFTDPYKTFNTNVMGTVNVLNTYMCIPTIQGVLVVSSDKCYHNKEMLSGYRETDELSQGEPYSASKGCTEIVAASYRDTYKLNIATARAGNVIGGGDWSVDRLIPDLVRAHLHDSKVLIRSPQSIRPWQHVLDCLYGYLLLGQKMMDDDRFAGAWNFGPSEYDSMSVMSVIEHAPKSWNLNVEYRKSSIAETNRLLLNSAKSRAILGWEPKFTTEESITRTYTWYENFYRHDIITTSYDINNYMENIK